MQELNLIFNFIKWFIIIALVVFVLLMISVAFSFREPSMSKRVAGRTSGRLTRSFKKATIPFYGKKGTGIYKNPSRTIKNKIYRKRTKKMF